MSEEIRIAKFLSQAQIASRRDAEKLVEKGLVKVNGKTITSPATKVTAEDKVTVDGKIVKQDTEYKLWAFFKPKGVITSTRDEKGRKTIYDILPKRMEKLKYVGRLDYNSEGLLLLTNSGEFSRKLEMPTSKIERTYKVRIFGSITKEILQSISSGITVNDIKYKPCIITPANNFKYNTHSNNWLMITLTEGKNREIRNIFESFDLQVTKLLRLSFGNIQLADLQPGEHRRVSDEELDELKSMVQ